MGNGNRWARIACYVIVGEILALPLWALLSQERGVRSCSSYARCSRGVSEAKGIAFSGSLLGTWQGSFDGGEATLAIASQQGASFRGVLTVRHPEVYEMSIAGNVSATTGQVLFQETKVLSEAESGTWALGINSGAMEQPGRLAGCGEDTRGKRYEWHFSR